MAEPDGWFGHLGGVIQRVLDDAVQWMHAQGDAAPWLFVAFLGVWIALTLPCSVLEIVPGYLFGWRVGFMVSLAGKALGALIVTVICRLFLRDRVQRFVFSKFPKFKAVGEALDEEGVIVFVVLRMSFVPTVVKNYGLASLPVPVFPVVFSALIAGIPFSVLWSFIGSTSSDLNSILAGEGLSKFYKNLGLEQNVIICGVVSLLLILGAGVDVIYGVWKRINAKLENSATPPRRSRNVAFSLLAAGVALASYTVTLIPGVEVPNLKDIMMSAVDWIREQGELGPLYYSVFLALWVAALLPCSILEMVPGYLFGFQKGFAVSVLGKNAGTVISLVLGRYLLRGSIQEQLLGRYPKLRALEIAIQQEGFPVLVMIRCAYLPMLIKNYGLSCLDVSLVKVWLASLISSGPFAALWTFVGASATNLADIFDGKLSARDLLPDNVALVGSVAVTVGGIFVYLLRSLGKRFQTILAEVESQQKEQAVQSKQKAQ